MHAVVTGADGFLLGYLITELLEHGYRVTGIDWGQRYGAVSRAYTAHPRYRAVRADARDAAILEPLLADADYFIAGAALVGGVGYFHRYPFDIFAANERLTLAGIDAAIAAQNTGRLRRLVLLSSSMVYENCTTPPFVEGDQLRCPPPSTAYGFQKLAAEKAVIAAHEQYGLCYTIIRPFNCVGIGEVSVAEVQQAFARGVWESQVTHVVPDLVIKAMVEAGPLRLLGDGAQVRHFTHGKDLAQGIRMAMESDRGACEDFNLAHPAGVTILELAQMIWSRCRPQEPFNYMSEPEFTHDVRVRVPSTEKAKNVLGWQAVTSLSDSVDELIAWVRTAAGLC